MWRTSDGNYVNRRSAEFRCIVRSWVQRCSGRQYSETHQIGLNTGLAEWRDDLRGASTAEKRVPRVLELEEGGKDMKGRKRRRHEEPGFHADLLDELGSRLKRRAAELREQGIPVDDEMRIDMDAFKGAVCAPEEVERDKATARILQQTNFANAADADDTERKLHRDQGDGIRPFPVSRTFHNIFGLHRHRGIHKPSAEGFPLFGA